jgi:hypothetical protein
VSGKDALLNDDRQEQQDSFASHVVVSERNGEVHYVTHAGDSAEPLRGIERESTGAGKG